MTRQGRRRNHGSSRRVHASNRPPLAPIRLQALVDFVAFTVDNSEANRPRRPFRFGWRRGSRLTRRRPVFQFRRRQTGPDRQRRQRTEAGNVQAWRQECAPARPTDQSRKRDWTIRRARTRGQPPAARVILNGAIGRRRCEYDLLPRLDTARSPGDTAPDGHNAAQDLPITPQPNPPGLDQSRPIPVKKAISSRVQPLQPVSSKLT